MSAHFRQAKLNKSVVRDLPKQTITAVGNSGFRIGETAFIAPSNIETVSSPTELVGKIVGKDNSSAAWWLAIFDNGRDSFFESNLHKLVLVEESAPLILSRALIQRYTYEIRPWNASQKNVDPKVGHVIVQKFISTDHQGIWIHTPEFHVVEIVFRDRSLYSKI